MKVLRTPDDRFANLPDWPFAPHYKDVTDADGTKLRVAYVDEGPRDGAVVLLMHGEPSHAGQMLPLAQAIAAAGLRPVLLELPVDLLEEEGPAPESRPPPRRALPPAR